MAQQDRASLKGFFETGNIPTESQFVDLIDSYINNREDGEAGEYVDSMSDLANINTPSLKDGASVYLNNFYSTSSGGGGEMYWDSSEAKANHNGGAIINPDHNSTPGSSGWYSSTGDSTDDAGTGCWKRPDVDSISLLAWGVTSSDANNEVRINAADSYYTGTILQFPPYKIQISDKIHLQNSNRLTGVGRLSHVEIVVSASDAIHIDCSNAEVDHLRVSGTSGEDDGADASGIHVYNTTNIADHEHIHIHHCWFYDNRNGVRIGYRTFDTTGDGNRDVKRIVKKFWINNCTFKDNRYKGIEVWGQNGKIYGNTIDMNGDSSLPTPIRHIRLVGAKNIHIFSNEFLGSSGYTIGINNAGMQGLTTFPENLYIYDNTMSEIQANAFHADHCRGWLKIFDNTIVGTADNDNYALSLRSNGDESDGTKNIIEKLHIADNDFESFAGFCYLFDGKFGRVKIKHNTFVSTLTMASNPGIYRSSKPTEGEVLDYFECVNNTILLSDDFSGAGASIVLDNTGADEIYVVQHNNIIPTPNAVNFGGDGTLIDTLDDGSGNSFSTNTELPAAAWSDPNA